MHRSCHRVNSPWQGGATTLDPRRGDTLWQRATDVRFANESFPNSSPARGVASRVQYRRPMPKHTSLGELITALYDAAIEMNDDEERNDDIVAACTVDVLLRSGERNRKALAELVWPLAVRPN